MLFPARLLVEKTEVTHRISDIKEERCYVEKQD